MQESPMIVVCPQCFAKNRLAASRLQHNPQCGRCHAALMGAKPVELNEQNFASLVAATDRPVVVDFWASWCGPCRMMAPHFEHAASQLGMLQFAKVNTEAAPQLASQYAIRSLPTLVLFQQGKEVARQSGAMTSTQMQHWLQPYNQPPV